MDPARIFTESLTPHPELENSQGQKLTKSTVIRARMPVKTAFLVLGDARIPPSP